MNRAFVALALMIVAAMFCLGVVVTKQAHAAGCNGPSEQEYRTKMKVIKPVFFKITGDGLRRALKEVNLRRIAMDPPKEPWNGDFILISMTQHSVSIVLFDKGCIVEKSGFMMQPAEWMSVMQNLNLKPEDLVQEPEGGA